MTTPRLRPPASIRLRLTLAVTVVFLLASTLVAIAAGRQLRTVLLDATRTNAETLLLDYIASPGGGDDPDGLEGDGFTRLSYYDEQGNELSALAFEAMVLESLSTDLVLPPEAFGLPPGVVVETGPVIIDVGGAPAPFVLTGPVREIESGPDLIAVAAPVAVGDQAAEIAVSMPTDLVDDSVAVVTTIALVLLPVLTVLVAGATWFTVSRVLHPVEAIRRHVEQTSPATLHHPIPASGTGDEIDRLAGTMNDMLTRLHRAGVQQRQFIADASHELRSPITATLATIETVGHELPPTEWPDLATVLTAEQQRLGALVDDLLLLAHLDEDGAGSRDDDVDLDELVLTEVDRHPQATVEASIEAPCRVTGSSRLLERLLSNLVDNANRHADHRVALTLRTDGDAAVLVVDDDGPGVPPDQREVIFDRFRRLDESRAAADGGAGLGLAIAHQHSGQLDCDESPLGGARFELRLPYSPASARYAVRYADAR